MHCAPGPCTVKFYASTNFDGFQVHDTQPKRFYYLVREGMNAAIYSVQCVFLPFECSSLLMIVFSGQQQRVRCHRADLRLCAAAPSPRRSTTGTNGAVPSTALTTAVSGMTKRLPALEVTATTTSFRRLRARTRTSLRLSRTRARCP